MRIRIQNIAAATLCVLSSALPAQSRNREPRPERDRDEPRPARIWGFGTSEDDDRPRIGITTGSSGKRDTLGVLVSEVTADGPAAKAGIEEGDRIAAINGVNLRLSASDAGEDDMEGVATRRLIRELGKASAGDEVELRVVRDGQTKTVKVKTVAARDLEPSFTFSRESRSEREERATMGVGLGTSGSRRDTLGILVSSVNDDGPAAKAGLEEGDRIASINGVDVRVPREDAGDWSTSSVRIRRLNRELEKAKAGDEVELRVYRGGQTRTVKVKTVRAKDLPGNRGGMFIIGDGGYPGLNNLRMMDGIYAPVAPMAPMPPMTPMAPMAPRAPRAPMSFGPVFPQGRTLYYDNIDGFGGVRMRISPELRTELRERTGEALRRAEELRSRIRSRVRVEMEEL